MLAGFGVVTTVLGLNLLLCGHATGSTRTIWIAKPLASTGFLLAAIGFGAFGSVYGILVLLALAFCWLGDVLLIPAGHRGTFSAGLGMFFLGHVWLIAAFFVQGALGLAVLGALAVVLLVAIAFRSKLRSHVPRRLLTPVWLYVAVIGLMVATSFGVVVAGGPMSSLFGALAFAISDLAVARHRFVSPSFSNKLWGLPLYYGGVLLLASTIAA